MYDNDELLLLHEQREGHDMLDFNPALSARKMSDGELNAAVATLQAEQARRAAIPADQRPNPLAVKIAADRHKQLYG